MERFESVVEPALRREHPEVMGGERPDVMNGEGERDGKQGERGRKEVEVFRRKWLCELFSYKLTLMALG